MWFDHNTRTLEINIGLFTKKSYFNHNLAMWQHQDFTANQSNADGQWCNSMRYEGQIHGFLRTCLYSKTFEALKTGKYSSTWKVLWTSWMRKFNQPWPTQIRKPLETAGVTFLQTGQTHFLIWNNSVRAQKHLTTTTATTATICGDSCPLSCASAEAYKLAQCTRPQGLGS